MNWKPLLKSELSFEVNTQVMPTKGNLVYEYNPFRNYRLTEDKYYYNIETGKSFSYNKERQIKYE